MAHEGEEKGGRKRRQSTCVFFQDGHAIGPEEREFFPVLQRILHRPAAEVLGGDRVHL